MWWSPLPSPTLVQYFILWTHTMGYIRDVKLVFSCAIFWIGRSFWGKHEHANNLDCLLVSCLIFYRFLQLILSLSYMLLAFVCTCALTHSEMFAEEELCTTDAFKGWSAKVFCILMIPGRAIAQHNLECFSLAIIHTYMCNMYVWYEWLLVCVYACMCVLIHFVILLPMIPALQCEPTSWLFGGNTSSSDKATVCKIRRFPRDGGHGSSSAQSRQGPNIRVEIFCMPPHCGSNCISSLHPNVLVCPNVLDNKLLHPMQFKSTKSNILPRPFVATLWCDIISVCLRNKRFIQSYAWLPKRKKQLSIWQ